MSNIDEHTTTKQAAQDHMNRYIVGFIGSIMLTVLAFVLVSEKMLSGWTIFIVLGVMAFAQAVLQLVFFLELTKKDGPRWKLGIFGFMCLVLFIVIAGSLWIMHSLNYRMMSPEQMNDYMQEQVDRGF